MVGLMRRRTLLTGVGAVCAGSALGLIVPKVPRQLGLTAVSGPTMGTYYRIVFQDDSANAAVLEAEAVKALTEVDGLMSTYRADSEVSLFNTLNAMTPMEMSDPTKAVIEEAVRIGDLTGGAFDVTVGPLAGAQLGSSCADCHSPVDMSLRVNRQAYIDAMVERGYEADPVKGLKGTPKEMRDHVCAQCHVEYYFKGEDAILTYPWSQWPKGEPLKIEMVEEHYEIARSTPGGFQADWTHAITKAPMLKMQHPEVEVVSSGKHASFIGCADCHMPRIERNGKTVTDHTMGSPLKKLDNCLSCHNKLTEDQLYQMVYGLQVRNVEALLRAEKAVLALIQDVAMVREELGKKDQFAQIADDKEREAEITKELTDVLDFHRRSSMRWDFIGASNSTGAHSPTEALRVLEQGVTLAQQGQALLQDIAAKHGIDLVPTTKPTLPDAPAVLKPGHIVGSLPPAITREADQAVRDWKP